MSPTPKPLPGSSREWHARVWKLAGPIIFSNLSVPLVGIVDTAVVGHLPDPVYIGAVALGAIIFNFVFWGFSFLRMGTTGFVAQAWGAHRGSEIRAVLARAIVLSLILGGALIALQIPIITFALFALDGGVTLEDHARSYFDFRIWAAPATLANYAILGTLIGMQNTRAVLISQLCLNLVNVLLDVLFVVGFDMGVAGVAAATLIAEYFAVAVGFFLIKKQLAGVGGQFEGRRMFNRRDMRAMLTVNVNILIRTLCLTMAFFLFTAKSTQFGELILAANAVLLHLLHVIAYGLDGFAHAAEALVGSAMGSRNRDAYKQATRVTTVWALVVALVIASVYGVFGESLVALITNIDSVRETAGDYLPWLVVAPLVSVWSYQLDGMFIGATRTAEMRNAMIFSLLFFVLTSWWLTDTLGNHGLWLSLIMFNLVRALTLALYFPRLGQDLH